MRIISCAAILLEEREHSELYNFLDNQHFQLDASTFLFHILDPLDVVPRNELSSFLRRPENGCRSALRQEISQLLFKETQGKFPALISCLQEAKNGSWELLRRRLKRKHENPKNANKPTLFGK